MAQQGFALLCENTGRSTFWQISSFSFSCAIIVLFMEIQQTLEIAHVNPLKSSPARLLNGGLRLKLLLVVVVCLSLSYFSHERLSRSEIGAVIKGVPIS